MVIWVERYCGGVFVGGWWSLTVVLTILLFLSLPFFPLFVIGMGPFPSSPLP